MYSNFCNDVLNDDVYFIFPRMFIEILCSLMTLTFYFSDNGIYNFNIKSDGRKTTFDDEGYSTILKIGEQQIEVKGTDNGVGKLDGLKLTTSLGLFAGNNYVRIQYIVHNENDEEKTFSLGTASDIQIGENDKAPVSNLAGNRGFIMTDGSSHIELFLRETYGSTNVDAYWYGDTRMRYTKMWESGTSESTTYRDLNNIDSAMTLSWKDRKIKPGETLKFSFLIGYGELKNHPELEVNKEPIEFYGKDDNIEISGKVSHKDHYRTAKVIAVIDDGGELVIAESLDVDAKSANFNGNLRIPDHLSEGIHKVDVWAVDDLGMPSNSYSYSFTILMPTQTPSPSLQPSPEPTQDEISTTNHLPSTITQINESLDESQIEEVTNSPSPTLFTEPIFIPMPSKTPDPTENEKLDVGVVKYYQPTKKNRWILGVIIGAIVALILLLIASLILCAIFNKDEESTYSIEEGSGTTFSITERYEHQSEPSISLSDQYDSFAEGSGTTFSMTQA